MFREMRPSTMILVTVLLAMLVVPMAFIDIVPKETPQEHDYPTAPPPPKRQAEEPPEDPESEPEDAPEPEEDNPDPDERGDSVSD